MSSRAYACAMPLSDSSAPLGGSSEVVDDIFLHDSGTLSRATSRRVPEGPGLGYAHAEAPPPASPEASSLFAPASRRSWFEVPLEEAPLIVYLLACGVLMSTVFVAVLFIFYAATYLG